MPCGPNARLTAYVAYQALALTDRDLLAAALNEIGYGRVDAAPPGTETSNSVPVLGSSRTLVGSAALVVRAEHLPAGFGDLAFVWIDGAYVPLVPSDSRAEGLMHRLRGAYGRAKATRLAEQARTKYRASMQQTVDAAGALTIRVRF